MAALLLAGTVAAGVAWRDVGRLADNRPALTGKVAPAANAPPVVDDAAVRPATSPALAEWALFGTPASPEAESVAPPAPPVVDEAALPASAAPFQLFGLIEADADAEARAILGTSDADQQEYSVGDLAPDGSKIHAVRSRAIILERDGQLEQMKLPELGEGGPLPDTVPKRFIPRRLPGAGTFNRPDGPPGAMPEAIAVPPPDFAPPPVVEAPMENGPDSQ